MDPMKAGGAVSALIALAVLAGCGKTSAPEADPSASPAASAPAPAASAAAASPMLEAASYPPRDDCRALPGWAAFRKRLETAVTQRDADGLAALSDPDILLDFGGGAGVEELRRRLGDKEYRLWEEIAALLPLGCGPHQEGGVAMPWIFANSPADADPYVAMLALGSDVPVRAEPDPASPVTARLNWAIVDIADGYEGPGKPFTEVKLPGGQATAFVETPKLRSLIDYRLIAEQGKQGWRITALIAGD